MSPELETQLDEALAGRVPVMSGELVPLSELVGAGRCIEAHFLVEAKPVVLASRIIDLQRLQAIGASNKEAVGTALGAYFRAVRARRDLQGASPELEQWLDEVLAGGVRGPDGKEVLWAELANSLRPSIPVQA